MNPSSSATPPPLKLITAAFPKGGGALPGMGESLSPVGMSGAVQLSVPLPLPAVRQAPALSLSYHSHQGNGPFGLGVTLTLSSIARQTSRGIPSYEEGRDTFLFEGEELVPDATAPSVLNIASAWWKVFRADGRCEGSTGPLRPTRLAA